ncbi:MAG: hypothetical protein WA775_12895 [Psychroserpens sp.]|uniref:hypothetical protein n=1 Tax=Psychroserpens sp. TaxID=2020870 RepID=UPI003C73061A
MSISKTQLLDFCKAHVNKRIANYKNEIETIKESIESNDKSNDVDDDSGNGKLFNDLEKNAIHLSDANKMLDSLQLIKPNAVHTTVVLGSVVTTDKGRFFLAVSIGKVEIENATYLIISKSSPIGELLMYKTVGEHFTFNNTHYTIEAIK